MNIFEKAKGILNWRLRSKMCNFAFNPLYAFIRKALTPDGIGTEFRPSRFPEPVEGNRAGKGQ
jgi:hypothetical protein